MALKAQKPPSGAYPRQLKALGDHLRARRLDLKITQKELADKLGTTVCTIHNWEKNTSNSSLPYIPKIIEFLDYVPYDTSELDFGKQIAIKRRLMCLRQKDLARLVGVDPSTIKHWENNQSRPSRKLMQRMSTFLTSNDLKGSAKH